MRLFELAYACHLYGEPPNSRYDTAYSRFLAATKPVFDILDHRHRRALLAWLNSWGCRQFARKFHDQASEHLRNWAQENLTHLPPTGSSLLTLTDVDFVNAGVLYASLRNLQASIRQRSGNSYPVTFGPIGAAKILFALRSQVFPPWDTSIRVHLGCDGSQESYIKYLQWVRHELQEAIADAEAHGIAGMDIPNALGRPFSSLPKLVDEYNWVTITKGRKLPSLEDLNDWWRWARSS
jgi:hypothetical protein